MALDFGEYFYCKHKYHIKDIYLYFCYCYNNIKKALICSEMDCVDIAITSIIIRLINR